MRRGRIFSGVFLAVGTLVLLRVISLWGDMLWFDSLGYGSRFWIALAARFGFAVVGLVIGAAVVWLLTLPLRSSSAAVRKIAAIAGAAVGLLWGLAAWPALLQFWFRSQAGVTEPVFGFDVSFFLFTLPMLNSVWWLLTLLALDSLAASAIAMYNNPQVVRRLAESQRPTERWDALVGTASLRGLVPVELTGGVLLIVIGCGSALSAFEVMYSRFGVVYGPGWTDLHVRLPAYFIVAGLFAIAGIVVMIASILQQRTSSKSDEQNTPIRRRWLTAGAPTVAVAGYLVGLVLLPGMFQWLYVQPSEISIERPYIANNIAATRTAFALDRIEEHQYPVSDQFDRSTAKDNQDILSQVRLWDPRALDSVYQQFQEIRLYYEFDDVDVDRYTIDGEYRQVMVSPREMALGNLPQQSQTFVNQRFKYTHGYGLTMAPVNEFTRGGLPNLLIKDVPPKVTTDDLAVDRPEIYYGELTDTHVIVNTTEKEFDYPQGDQNVYTRYDGQGGVQLSNWWRKFIYGWKFDGTRLFVSSYPTEESRIQFHRQVHDRLETLAPFLRFDRDAYVVLDEGKMFWIVDGYTASNDYPYSEPYRSPRRMSRYTSGDEQTEQLDRMNYLRNSVKAVVDAYEGTVDLYIFEPDDPLIRTWDKIYPGLLKSRDKMPDSLREHVRYPEGMLLTQGKVYTRYHMTDPDVFYNQEDLWVRATEKYYNRVQEVEPYYVMWRPTDKSINGDSDRTEFILMQPFTPKNRQVLIGWIAGMSDGENYGRLLSYQFPKDKRVLGTQQVETKIDQDSFLSKQLSLWDQRGSSVVRGNVLVIPINNTLLYVEPIYLQAEAAAYPELRLVALMQNDELSYAETFEDALAGLYSADDDRTRIAGADDDQTDDSLDDSTAELIQQASESFDRYLEALGEREFDKADTNLQRLSRSLEELNERTMR